MGKIIERVRVRERLCFLNKGDREEAEEAIRKQKERDKLRQENIARYQEACKKYGAANVFMLPSGGIVYREAKPAKPKPWWRLW